MEEAGRKHPCDLRIVYVTFPDRQTAKKISKSLLEKRLIACCNIFDGITSMYWWENEIQEDAEVSALLKTRKEQVEAVIQLVLEEHPYDVPAILSLPIESTHPQFAHWIVEQTAK